MKKNYCLLFNFHHTVPLRHFSFFDIGKNQGYTSKEEDTHSFSKKYNSHYAPALQTLLALVKSKGLVCSVYMSGLFIELLQKEAPKMVKALGATTEKGQLLFVSGTYSNSLVSVYSMPALDCQIRLQEESLKKHFGIKPPKVFKNSLNIFSNKIANHLGQLGYRGMVANYVEWYAFHSNPFQVYKSKGENHLNIILSNDIKSACNTDAPAATIAVEIGASLDASIPQLALVKHEMDSKKASFLSLDEAIGKSSPSHVYDIPSPLGGSESASDLSFFIENGMQKEALKALFVLEEAVMKSGDELLIRDWTCLSDANYFLPMTLRTKTSDTTRPYDQYISFMNILADIGIRLGNA